MFFLLGVLCLLLFDNDHSALPLEHRILKNISSTISQRKILERDECVRVFSECCVSAEGPHRSSVTHFLYRLLSFLGVPDHKVERITLWAEMRTMWLRIISIL